jgi:hypothetical protein
MRSVTSGRSSHASNCGDRVQPGSSAFARMPYLPSSTASVWVSEMMPAFAAP